MCRCCSRRKVNRPRGLCWTCYYNPDNGNKFPSTSKFSPTRRGGEPTEAELDAMIAENYSTMPDCEPRQAAEEPVYRPRVFSTRRFACR